MLSLVTAIPSYSTTMFFKLFALFAVLAVAFANPNPKPEPQVLAYPGAAYPYGAYSGYAPVAAYAAPYAAAAYPYGYAAYYR